MKTEKKVVTHPRLYMSVDGVVQHVPKDTVLSLTPVQVKQMRGRVADPSKAGELDPKTGKPPVDKAQAELDAVRKENEELKKALAKKAK